MKVCNLTNGVELHADIHGHPYYQYRTHVGECSSHISREWHDLVEQWQSDPANDCLRARGDARWQAAAAFVSRPVWTASWGNQTSILRANQEK